VPRSNLLTLMVVPPSCPSASLQVRPWLALCGGLNGDLGRAAVLAPGQPEGPPGPHPMLALPLTQSKDRGHGRGGNLGKPGERMGLQIFATVLEGLTRELTSQSTYRQIFSCPS